MQDPHIILGIHITGRARHASEVQSLLTGFGGSIKTRLGLHDIESGDSPNGLILLEMHGPVDRADALLSGLNAIEGVDCQKLRFEH
ncbi:MAG: hypothetical protein ACOCYP_04445 [Planctomycetota bacterium]